MNEPLIYRLENEAKRWSGSPHHIPPLLYDAVDALLAVNALLFTIRGVEDRHLVQVLGDMLSIHADVQRHKRKIDQLEDENALLRARLLIAEKRVSEKKPWWKRW